MKQNVLLIIPDQLRADYLSSYGHPTVETRHLSALAQESLQLNQCYCAAPLCGPSRVSLVTSTYVGEHNQRNYGGNISPDVPNLVGVLKRNGYRTGMFGKNHMFTESRLEEMWDEMDNICLGNYDNHPDYIHSFSAFTLEKGHPYDITGRLTDETIAFMQSAEQPFLAWVNYQDPHPAYCCPPPYDTMFSPDDIELPPEWHLRGEGEPVRNEVWRKHSEMDLCSDDAMKRAIAFYMGKVRYVDDCVGRMMAYLKESGKEKNTIVLFLSDHGELLGYRGMTHKLPAFYDCLTRIPVLLRAPQKDWAGKQWDALVEEVDLVPTLLELLGIGKPNTMVGRSFAGAMDRGDGAFRDSVLVEAGCGAPTCKTPIPGRKIKAPYSPTHFGPGAMVRQGRYKLSVYADDNGELYDVEKDPLESENLFGKAEYQSIQQELTMLLLRRELGVKVRDVPYDPWDTTWYAKDVRCCPLE